MVRVRTATVMTLLVAGGVLLGAQTPPRPATSQPVSDAVRASWENAKRNIKDSAVLVPEANFGFKPVDTVRTFGQIIGHVAGAQYLYCAAAKGEKSPKAEDAFEALATKAALLQAWNDSVAYCDAAYKALTDKSASDAINMPFGGGKGVRIATLLGNIEHLGEHYGNLVTYMRIKGIVPPTSRR